MNTDSFKTGANTAACQVENELRSICGMGAIDPIHFNPTTPPAPPAAPGPAYTTLPANTIYEPSLSPPQPSAGSFHTKSIDTVNDAINFFKAAGVIMLGASLHPSLIIPTGTIITASFFYAIRNKFLAA